jgi:hypothetical protein
VMHASAQQATCTPLASWWGTWDYVMLVWSTGVTWRYVMKLWLMDAGEHLAGMCC